MAQRPKPDQRTAIYSTFKRQNNHHNTFLHARLQKYLQSNFNMDEKTFKTYQRLCLHMLKYRVDPASLDDLKFSFLELSATDTVDVSAFDMR